MLLRPQASSAPDVISCQPTTTAVRPWLRHIAVLMRPLEQQQQQRLPAVVARCSPQDSSISVLSAAPSSTSSWPAGGLDGPDPLVIHLPGADGTSESSPADPASAGLPATPTVVTDSNSLTLRDPAAVQHRQQDQLGFRPGSGSKTLSTMLPRSPSPLQVRAAAEAPATRALGPTGLQARPAGPLGFLPALQWSNTTMYWGSPIGGTLYINPPVDEPAAAAASGANTSSKQRPSQANRQFWGSPIGGTLYINPPVEEGPTPSTPQQDTSAPSRQHSSSNVFWGSPIGGTLYINPHVDDSLQHSSAGQLATGLHQAAAGAAAAAAASSSTASPGSTKSRHSRLPFPLFKWGSSNNAQWGAPIGGTLYINPQAPADWHDGSWGSGSSGFGSSSGGGGPGSGSSSSSNGGGTGAGAGSGSRGGSSSGIGGNGVTSKQRSTVYASARAGQAAWGGVPPGVGLAKLGVGLMAAVAAAAMAVYLRAATGSTSGNTTSTYSTSASQHDAETPSAAAAGSAVDVSGARAAGRASVPAAAAEDAPEGPGFHQWMVQRLQSTLDAFEAEQSLLRTELAVLNSLPVAKKGMLGGLRDLKRWLSRGAGGAAGGASSSSSSNITSDGPGALSEAAAVASAVQGGTTKAGALSAGEVAKRVAEIQEQLESIDVPKAALSAEMGEHQQLLQKAQQEQQVAQDQFRALVGR